MIKDKDIEEFSKICKETEYELHERSGIGTYKEKIVHMSLKAYFCKNREQREVKVGRYVADAVYENTIYEIQTGGFYPLKRKLATYLSDTEMDVIIVYPVAYVRRLVWVDLENGETSIPKKVAPDKYRQKLLRELMWIGEFLDFTRVRLKLVLLSVDEYKILDGRGESKKIKASKLDRIPRELLDVVDIDSRESLREILVPKTLPREFCTSEFGKATGLQRKGISAGIKTLKILGIIKSVKTDGRKTIYTII